MSSSPRARGRHRPAPAGCATRAFGERGTQARVSAGYLVRPVPHRDGWLFVGYDGLPGATHGLLARVGADGRLDPAFGSGGIVHASEPGMYLAATALADGRLVAAGASAYLGGHTLVAIHDADGMAAASIRLGLDDGGDVGFSVAAQTDGKLVVASAAPGDVIIARVGLDGELDAGFVDRGRLSLGAELGGPLQGVLQQRVAIDPRGRLVVLFLDRRSATWSVARVMP